MKKYIITFSVAIFSLAFGISAMAEENATGSEPKPLPPVAQLLRNNNSEMERKGPEGKILPPRPGVFASGTRDVLKGKAEDLRLRASTTRTEMQDKLKEGRDDFKKFASSTKGEFRDNASSTRKEMEDRLKEKRGELKERASSTRAEFRQDVKDRFLKQATRKIEEVKIHLDNAIKRFHQISERIASRITKIKTAGGNTTAVESALATANTDITAVEKLVSDLSTIVLAPENPQGSLEIIKTAVENVRKAIDTAQKSIKTAADALKEVAQTVKPVATTTTP